jgi:hypothetical protein
MERVMLCRRGRQRLPCPKAAEPGGVRVPLDRLIVADEAVAQRCDHTRLASVIPQGGSHNAYSVTLLYSGFAARPYVA